MRIVVLLALGPLSLLLGEGVVRLVSPQPASWIDVYRRAPDRPFYDLEPSVTRFVDTGETRWWIHTDAEGHRVERPGAAGDEDERPAVLVLGDSFTFGQGVDYERTFVSALAARAPSLRFVNAGVPGHGPVQYRQRLELELARGLRPREVFVVFFVGNDLHDCVWSKDSPVYEGVLGGKAGARFFVKRASHLYRLLSRVYHARSEAAHLLRAHETETYTPSAWSCSPLREARLILRQEVARIAALCAARGIELRAAVIPATRGAAGTATPGLDPDLPVREVMTTCRILGIPCVDTTPALRTAPVSETYFVFDSHLTPLGHTLVAEAIARAGVLPAAGAGGTALTSAR